MDPVGLVQGALAPLQRARDVIQGATDLKTNLRRRYGDYSSIIESLKNKPDVVNGKEIERELRRLTELFTRVAELIGEYTAAPADGRLTKVNIKVKRGADYEDVNQELDEIDREVMRQLAIMSLKGAISSSEMELLQGVDQKVDRLTSLVNDMRPPTLPDMATVPAGALALPHGYVVRAAVQEVSDDLTKPEDLRAPYTVVGMGGGGKSVLVSAVVRNAGVREYFRGGIFWVRVGRGAKNGLLPLLQGLTREMGAAPTDAPHGMPHALDSLEKTQQHLATVASAATFPRLVVLDDVWEREVVDALLPLGLKILVTTRDRAVVGVPTGCLKLGDMTEEEALKLLLKTSRTVGQPGEDVQTQMTKVVALCGRLPLVLAIAGSMPVVNGNGLTAGAWGKLATELEVVATKMEACDEDSDSLNVVLETSFNALSLTKKRAFKKTAVLAPGAVASTEMLRNLWETEDTGGTREEAQGLVSKCLLQDVGGGGYRVHDLVLEFVKIKIAADVGMVKRATALQAHYLARLDVLESYQHSEHGAGNQGLFFLDALWRSVEKLSGNPGLEAASYRTSLGQLESCEATADVAAWYLSVGVLFNIQGKFEDEDPMSVQALKIYGATVGQEHPDYALALNNRAELLCKLGKYDEAEPLFQQATEILEKSLAPDHPNVATLLNNRAELLYTQGKYEQAGPLYERSQAIREKVLGPEHPDVAASLNNRAMLFSAEGKYDQAEQLLKRAIVKWEAALGSDHPYVSLGITNRADALKMQGKYAEAEPLFERSQAIREKVLGPRHPDVGLSLNNRALLLSAQGKYADAEPLFERATEILENGLGPDHPTVATLFNNRADLLRAQGKYKEAEPLYKRSLAIDEKVYGPDHPKVATDLNSWAELLSMRGESNQAEPLFARSQAIREKALGPDHPDVAISLNNQGELLRAKGKYAEAEPLLERSQAIQEKILGPEHPALATILNNRARLLSDRGKDEEAAGLYKRALAIDEKVHGPDHPEVATDLNNLAALLAAQGKYGDAGPLYERVTQILEKALGPGHPNIATVLNNRATLLLAQAKYAEAEALCERSQAIREKVLGPEHPLVARSLTNRAVFLEKQDKHKEAVPLLERAFSILSQHLGRNHPQAVDARVGLERALKRVREQHVPYSFPNRTTHVGHGYGVLLRSFQY